MVIVNTSSGRARPQSDRARNGPSRPLCWLNSLLSYGRYWTRTSDQLVDLVTALLPAATHLHERLYPWGFAGRWRPDAGCLRKRFLNRLGHYWATRRHPQTGDVLHSADAHTQRAGHGVCPFEATVIPRGIMPPQVFPSRVRPLTGNAGRHARGRRNSSTRFAATIPSLRATCGSARAELCSEASLTMELS